MSIRIEGHEKGCGCSEMCRWAAGMPHISRFNIFTDIEIGHLSGVLRPGRMLAEVKAEVERRQKYYEDLEREQAKHDTCDICKSFNRDDLSIVVIAGINIYYCPPCYEEWQATKEST